MISCGFCWRACASDLSTFLDVSDLSDVFVCLGFICLSDLSDLSDSFPHVVRYAQVFFIQLVVNVGICVDFRFRLCINLVHICLP